MSAKIKHPYFAHAVNLYDTPFERAIVEFIANHFGIRPEDVENPNQPHHQAGYTEYAKRPKLADQHKGMNYFYDCVLPSCDGCVAMPFLDNRMGLGVAGEAKWFVERNLPVHLVEFLVPAVLADALRDQVCPHTLADLIRIRPATKLELACLCESDSVLVVPHEETRLRTWLVYGRTMRPYAEAHLARLPLPAGFYPDEK